VESWLLFSPPPAAFSLLESTPNENVTVGLALATSALSVLASLAFVSSCLSSFFSVVFSLLSFLSSAFLLRSKVNPGAAF